VEPRWERLKGCHAHGAEVAIDLLNALDDRRLVVHCAILAAEAAHDKPMRPEEPVKRVFMDQKFLTGLTEFTEFAEPERSGDSRRQFTGLGS
jgi:hypothetical protein